MHKLLVFISGLGAGVGVMDIALGAYVLAIFMFSSSAMTYLASTRHEPNKL